MNRRTIFSIIVGAREIDNSLHDALNAIKCSPVFKEGDVIVVVFSDLTAYRIAQQCFGTDIKAHFVAEKEYPTIVAILFSHCEEYEAQYIRDVSSRDDRIAAEKRREKPVIAVSIPLGASLSGESLEKLGSVIENTTSRLDFSIIGGETAEYPITVVNISARWPLGVLRGVDPKDIGSMMELADCVGGVIIP